MKLSHLLFVSAAMVALTPAAGLAATAPQVVTTVGAEGADVQAVVVTAERDYTAATAPSKGALDETQPQSLITHKYIDQATPEAGDYTTVVLIAPSVAGVSQNGGGVGDTNTVTLRGFQDGQFNVTFDGIAFGDANDTTHHPAAFFPSSTIGAAVVDRGPGAAGDLGQANFGGAIHLFSQNVANAAGASQKITYGSFNTQSYVTTLQSGPVAQLGGTKLMLSLDERSSDGELSHSSGLAFNQTLKAVVPIGDKFQLTAFTSFNYTRYYLSDVGGTAAGAGITASQLQKYGINFALNNIPTDEHYYKFNQVKKHTDFNYLDLKGDLGGGWTIEDQLYDYFYSNHTESTQSNADDVMAPPSASSAPSFGGNDIGGYLKLNRYQTFGDILRVNKDLGFGKLRVGALAESSWAMRSLYNVDLTTGAPDYGYGSAAGTNASYIEPSRWFQTQVFADFEWRPLANLTITPGIKQLDYKRTINASVEGSGQAAVGSRTYDKTLYFLTSNYRLTDNLSVYAQGATSFLIPPVKTLAAAGGTTAATQPQETATYQAGVVYSSGKFSFDADIYRINATNVLVNQTHTTCQCYRNMGSGVYSGVEAQGAYTVGYGLTLFANGSVNTAKNTNPGPGQSASAFQNAPKGTAAGGALFQQGPWTVTTSAKLVGAQLASDGATHISAYTTIDASAAYDFGRFKLKLSGFNLADHRALLDYDGTYYAYQVGRQIELTLQAKF
ncbi:MAG: TonB-dependent receptor [Pseudomonadota bacterium]